ncbi:hypothetical protein JTB14_005843 [Gonioctena quinquepunctata]|nr:hypothetical protein JTB14_005843 [Gonioctena quinquepunctata]
MDVSDRTLSSSDNELEKRKENSEYRPLSYYDNNNPSESRNLLSSVNNNASIQQILKIPVSPPQTVYLNTTVPLNIATEDIAGKHTPTRNSLRHSRMVVLNKSGQAVTTSTVSTNLKYKRLGKLLLLGISLVSGLLMAISLWLLLWSPNLRSRDNPYWSAIPAIISGFLGITYLTCCFKECTHNRKVIYLLKSLKYISITTSVIAIIATATIFFFSLIHLIALDSATCAPPRKLESTCMCNFTQGTLSTDSYHYVDLSCPEVINILWILILVTCVTTAVISLFEFVYLYLHWLSRDIHAYTRVPTTTNMTAMKAFNLNR